MSLTLEDGKTFWFGSGQRSEQIQAAESGAILANRYDACLNDVQDKGLHKIYSAETETPFFRFLTVEGSPCHYRTISLLSF